MTKYGRYLMQNKNITTEHMSLYFVTEQCVYVAVVLVFSLHTLDSEISNNTVHMVIFC